MNAADLRPSHIVTLVYINSSPRGVSIHAIGREYAETLKAAGLITITPKGTCKATPAAAVYGKNSPDYMARNRAEARGAVLSGYGRARF